LFADEERKTVLQANSVFATSFVALRLDKASPMHVIQFLKLYSCAIFVFAILIGQADIADAQTVLVDFGSNTSFRGLSVTNPDTNGNYWNSLVPGTPGINLIDINNEATTLDLFFDTPVGTDSFNGPAGATDPLTLMDDVQRTDIDSAALGPLGGSFEAAFDYAASPGGADNRTRFQIQQLDPTKKYTLTFFGSHSFSTDSVTVYSVYSDNTYTTPVGTASLEVQVPEEPFNMHNRDKVATISDLSPQADDILYVEFVGSNGNLGYLNDFLIDAVSIVLPGDYNGDGAVDAADYVVWRKDPASFGGNPDGYDTWRENFGTTVGGGAGSTVLTTLAVPEPKSFAIAVVAAIAILWPLRRS
jgi:hypothetical protein